MAINSKEETKLVQCSFSNARQMLSYGNNNKWQQSMTFEVIIKIFI
jgi:hypothetical protein